MADDEDLDNRALELGERWVAMLEGEPEGVRRTFAFLATLAMIGAGQYRLLFRGERDGRRVLVAVDPYGERIFQLDDPELGGAEGAAVREMARVLGLRTEQSSEERS